MGLDAPAETEAVLYLSYVVSNASWNSAYDVRVFTKDQAMKVSSYIFKVISNSVFIIH